MAWGTYAWLTNTADPEEGAVRLAVFAAAAAMLVAALATPAAFGAEAVVFGFAYFLVRALHLVLVAIAARDDPELRRAVLRWAPGAFSRAVTAGRRQFLRRVGRPRYVGRRAGR